MCDCVPISTINIGSSELEYTNHDCGPFQRALVIFFEFKLLQIQTNAMKDIVAPIIIILYTYIRK